MRKLYVDDNPNKDNLAALETLGTTGTYDVTHTRFHTGFRNQIAARGYRDLYLFDLKGFMVYSVNKADDFGTSFAEGGPLATTGLGQVFQQAVAIENPDDLVFADFSAYARRRPPGQLLCQAGVQRTGPQGRRPGHPAAVRTARRRHRRPQRVWAKPAKSDRCGADGLLRSDSTFTADNDAMVDPLRHARAGTAHWPAPPPQGETSAYRGTDMLVAAAPITTPAGNWAAVAVDGRPTKCSRRSPTCAT